jgi:hypothetical protein
MQQTTFSRASHNLSLAKNSSAKSEKFLSAKETLQSVESFQQMSLT